MLKSLGERFLKIESVSEIFRDSCLIIEGPAGLQLPLPVQAPQTPVHVVDPLGHVASRQDRPEVRGIGGTPQTPLTLVSGEIRWRPADRRDVNLAALKIPACTSADVSLSTAPE